MAISGNNQATKAVQSEAPTRHATVLKAQVCQFNMLKCLLRPVFIIFLSILKQMYESSYQPSLSFDFWVLPLSCSEQASESSWLSCVKSILVQTSQQFNDGMARHEGWCAICIKPPARLYGLPIAERSQIGAVRYLMTFC